ncbi:hypothetical protein HKK58_14160 [Pseudomonas sp. ADAK22]|uniref:Nmad2 family putative nucleotide modification protein n=1 Tax=Pseudomonas sp. ADAK22 TaxID=2730851 RepID=UPI0014644B34|nr:hypothetical protein [Pseudomonas sp. ADAK22]QJI13628.1 hypothetical protein HKK58_14160 [Pseudomonas sp. ADAK22]
MTKVYMYVVDRDFGFAPNPFHGLCTLATCKPRTRRVAKVGDWIVGMGGGRLRATGKCIFAMKVSHSETFNGYWSNPLYKDKKPLRNGSKKMIVGDNIYWKKDGDWQQLNSHHSFPDGSPNPHNIKNDTQTDVVLISDYFFYFGAGAVIIPEKILKDLGYANGRDHRKFPLHQAQPLIDYLEREYEANRLYGDPYDFELAKSRYSAENNKVTV